MPSIFSSRRRGSSQPPMSRSTTTSATLAASQAFMNTNKSSTSLSSAAAAAALRSLTSSPEPVGNIQTKRTLRRGSVTSLNSANGGRGGPGHPGLARRDSQSSMSERTFRSPSPARSISTRNNSVRLSQPQNAPPVPAIPTNISAAHRRSSSLESSQRTPQSSNADRRSMQPSGRQLPATRLSNVAEQEEQNERSDTRNSVNFSRPISSPPASPTFSAPPTKNKYTHGTGGWFSGATGVAANVSVRNSQPSSSATVAANSSKKLAPVDVANEAQSPSREYVESYTVFDPNSRTFVTRQRVVQRKVEPPSPDSTSPQALTPGTWDPNTRRIVPLPVAYEAPVPAQPQQNASRNVATAGPYMEPPPRNPKRLSTESLPIANPKPQQAMAQSIKLQDSQVQNQSDSIRQDTTDLSTRDHAPSHERHISLDIPRPSIEPNETRRQASISPHRARFSPSPVQDSVRHKPPSRAMSPVKSAMKPSPAPSLRATSPLPVTSAASKIPPSDMSDTASQTSRDGTPKPKKSVRVSFDERANEVVPIDLSTTPTRFSQVYDGSVQTFDDMDEEGMTPRPALPSFGSVRKARASPPAEDRPVSSDHAIGSILTTAQREQVKPSSPEPVEAFTGLKPEPTITTHDFASAAPGPEAGDEQVPNINLLPPTPSADEETRRLIAPLTSEPSFTESVRDSMEGIIVPGGFVSATEKESAATEDQVLAEPEPSPAVDVVHQDDTHDARLVGTLDAITEDTDDEFSDAAEDLTELEDGGFASLNAIANSPVTVTKDVQRREKLQPESPTRLSAPEKLDIANPVSESTNQPPDWSATTAFWSNLSQAQRQQIEKGGLSSDDELLPLTTNSNRHSTISIKSAMKPGTAYAKPPALPVENNASSKVMRRSMREPQDQSSPAQGGAQSGEIHMRRSMRDPSNHVGSPQPSITKALTQSRPPARPMSSESSVASDQGFGRGSNTQVMGRPPSSFPATGGAFSSRLERKYTNDSDSESSFKKKKRSSSATVDADGRYNMKRSMRASSVDIADSNSARPISPDPPRRGKRSLSIRSLSPSGSMFSSRSKQEKLRESLRGTSEPKPQRMSLRGNPMAKSRQASSKVATSNTRFRSRFADSDDDDDDQPAGRGFFRSRFADSDDDEPTSPGVIPADLTPVRGIPRKAGRYDGDSTDLEDEDSNPRKASRKRDKQKAPLVPDPADIEKAMDAARRKLGIADPSESKVPESHEGLSLQNGSLRKPALADVGRQPSTISDAGKVGGEKKSRSFMGILRRNRGSTQSVPTIGPRSVEPAPPVPRLPDHFADMNKANGSVPSSPNGRPTRRLQRGNSNMSTATAPAHMSPTFTKGGDSWPLPSVSGQLEPNFGDDRPNTADAGVLQNGRGGKAVRIAELDADGNPINPSRDVFSSRTGRKKKFGLLRRAFGLND